MYKHYFIYIIFLLLSSCGNNSNINTTNTNTTNDSIKPNQLLETKLLDKTILSEIKPSTWIDANKNGISDNIDSYIKANYLNAADKQAAEQYARHLKPSDLLSSTNTVSKSKPKPVECVFYAFDVKHKKPSKPRPNDCKENIVIPPSNGATIIAGLENSGDIPKLERTNTLAGIDNDKNGIRDDIDTYIQKNYPQLEQRKAVEQYAKAMQLTLLTDLTDTLNLKRITTKLDRGMDCIYSKFKTNSTDKNPSVVSSEIESIISNTKPRLLAYLAYNKALDGMAFMLQEGDTCE